MTILAIATFLALTVLALILSTKVIRQAADGWERSQFVIYAVLLAATACLLLRPHQDTFIGLDTSAYRNMVRAFDSGRGFHDVDDFQPQFSIASLYSRVDERKELV